MKILIASFMLLSNIGLEWFDSHFHTYDKIQKQVFEYAEPGFMEYKSSELFIRHLKRNGGEDWATKPNWTEGSSHFPAIK